MRQFKCPLAWLNWRTGSPLVRYCFLMGGGGGELNLRIIYLFISNQTELRSNSLNSEVRVRRNPLSICGQHRLVAACVNNLAGTWWLSRVSSLQQYFQCISINFLVESSIISKLQFWHSDSYIGYGIGSIENITNVVSTTKLETMKIQFESSPNHKMPFGLCIYHVFKDIQKKCNWLPDICYTESLEMLKCNLY